MDFFALFPLAHCVVISVTLNEFLTVDGNFFLNRIFAVNKYFYHLNNCVTVFMDVIYSKATIKRKTDFECFHWI